MQLYLIGAGPMEPDLRRTASGHANVHFTGLIPNASRLVPALDVYAQTSLSEGRSLSMLEAMAAGLPCVVSAWDGYRASLRHGTDGFLCECRRICAPPCQSTSKR